MAGVDAATVKYWRDMQRWIRHHNTYVRIQAGRLEEHRLHDVADLLEQAGQELDGLILALSADDPKEKGGQD